MVLALGQNVQALLAQQARPVAPSVPLAASAVVIAPTVPAVASLAVSPVRLPSIPAFPAVSSEPLVAESKSAGAISEAQFR